MDLFYFFLFLNRCVQCCTTLWCRQNRRIVPISTWNGFSRAPEILPRCTHQKGIVNSDWSERISEKALQWCLFYLFNPFSGKKTSFKSQHHKSKIILYVFKKVVFLCSQKTVQELKKIYLKYWVKTRINNLKYHERDFHKINVNNFVRAPEI